MATQLKVDELKGCKSYFEWLCEKVIPEEHRWIVVDRRTGRKMFADLVMEYRSKLDDVISLPSLGKNGADPPSCAVEDIAKVKLCRYLYGVDFTVEDTCPIDATQGVNGMELRRRYAESVGKESGKSARDIDRIRKSIHGKCSVFELLVHLCNRLDEMTNEEESGATIYKFFDIMLENLEIDITDSETGWATVIGNFLHRNYNKDGSGGGLFPVKNCAGKDLRSMPLWDQLNTWLNENLNEDAEFEW